MSSTSEILTQVGKLIEEKEGAKVIELLDKLESDSSRSLNFEERHACSYYRVCAIAYTGDHEAFQRALDAYNNSYRELFRIARAYNHLTKDKFPASLERYVLHYIKAMDTLWLPISHFAMQMVGGADNVADVFTNRYHTESVDAYKRSDSRSKYLEAVRQDSSDAAGLRRLFKALSSAGFLVSSFGLIEDKVDKPQVEKGIALIKEAESLSDKVDIDPLDLSRNLFDQAQLYKIIGEKDQATSYFKRVVELLKDEPRNQSEIVDGDVEQLSDPLYLLALKEL